ncbi:TPA: UTP--glucose-1-phosphate uridylyltransferase, partial [Bacillus cereus]
MKKVRKAIIPAAGLGTRFLPATKAMPKEMLPIVDKPTIQYIIEEAIESGIEDIIVVTGKGKRAIEDHFDHSFELEQNLLEKGKYEMLEKVQASSKINIHYIRQKEPKGLGHAVWCARKFIGNEPFAVLLGDDIVQAETPCLRQLMDQYESTQSSVIGVQTVPENETHRYGIIDPVEQNERRYQVRQFVEKPAQGTAPSNLAIMGRY